MQLTVAMGLRYEPGADVSLLTDFKHGQESATARPENRLPQLATPVIDVEAIEVREGRIVQPEKDRHFPYLVYDLHAGVVPIAQIGPQLDATV